MQSLVDGPHVLIQLLVPHFQLCLFGTGRNNLFDSFVLRLKALR